MRPTIGVRIYRVMSSSATLSHFDSSTNQSSRLFQHVSKKNSIWFDKWCILFHWFSCDKIHHMSTAKHMPLLKSPLLWQWHVGALSAIMPLHFLTSLIDSSSKLHNVPDFWSGTTELFSKIGRLFEDSAKAKMHMCMSFFNVFFQPWNARMIDFPFSSPVTSSWLLNLVFNLND